MSDPIDGQFTPSYIKLQRAQKFIDEFAVATEQYKDSQPITATMDLSAEPGIRLEWKGVGLMPGAICGDAIHNLRTALDLMASELARLNGKPDKNVYFPFADSAATFQDAIKRRNFNNAGPSAVALLNTFQPYRGGNALLRALHDLDIHDKHTSLILVGTALTIEIAGFYDIDNLHNHTISPVLTGFSLRWPDGHALSGCVLDTLKDLMDIVKGVIEAFAKLPRA